MLEPAPTWRSMGLGTVTTYDWAEVPTYNHPNRLLNGLRGATLIIRRVRTSVRSSY